MITPINMGQKKQKTNPLEYVSKGLDMANSVASIGSKVSDMKFGGKGNATASAPNGYGKPSLMNDPNYITNQFAKYRMGR